MKILGITIGHDCSAAVMDDGTLSFYQMEERMSRVKHDWIPENIIDFLVETNQTCFDIIVVHFLESERNNERLIFLKNFIEKNFEYREIIIDSKNHHFYHAYLGYVNSNFDECLCFTFDGAGSTYNLESQRFKEIESIYLLSEDKQETLFKHYHIFDNSIPYHSNINEKINFEFNNLKISRELSVGWEFEKESENAGFHWTDGGKIMGLSQYFNHKEKLIFPYDTDEWKDKVDSAYYLQQKTQQKVAKIIEKYVEKTGIRNVVVSGGYGLNCIANSYYLKTIKNINLHVDPLCLDSGLSIAIAFYWYKKITNKKPKRIENLYLGYSEEKYDISNLKSKPTTDKEVADLLYQGNVIALFQGKSEAGQRALGNRSILFSPQIKGGRDYINTIKGRENFRPFAGTILSEYASDWFVLDNIKDSPFMMYSFDANKFNKCTIPSVIHVNETSRIQTIKKEQNKNFYNLIYEFYKKSGIPMVGNTSFNCAGEPLVDTFEHAIKTSKKCNIKYLYLPEIKTLITVD